MANVEEELLPANVRSGDAVRTSIVTYQQFQDARVISTPFVSDVRSMGSDPESLNTPTDGVVVARAFRKALNASWRPDAQKYIIVVLDGVPDEFGEKNAFPWGDIASKRIS